ESHLQAVQGELAPQPQATRIVHQHIEPWVAIQKLSGQSADLLLHGEVGKQCLSLCVACIGSDLRQGVVASGLISANDDQPRAPAGQFARGYQADTGSRSGDQAYLAA